MQSISGVAVAFMPDALFQGVAVAFVPDVLFQGGRGPMLFHVSCSHFQGLVAVAFVPDALFCVACRNNRPVALSFSSAWHIWMHRQDGGAVGGGHLRDHL